MRHGGAGAGPGTVGVAVIDQTMPRLHTTGEFLDLHRVRADDP
jgi:hypothetical protein